MSNPSQGSPNEVRVIDSTYTAVIIVNRSRTTCKANERGYFEAPQQTSAGQLAKIEVSSTTLEGLALKIKQHTDLLEDS